LSEDWAGNEAASRMQLVGGLDGTGLQAIEKAIIYRAGFQASS